MNRIPPWAHKHEKYPASVNWTTANLLAAMNFIVILLIILSWTAYSNGQEFKGVMLGSVALFLDTLKYRGMGV